MIVSHRGCAGCRGGLVRAQFLSCAKGVVEAAGAWRPPSASHPTSCPTPRPRHRAARSTWAAILAESPSFLGQGLPRHSTGGASGSTPRTSRLRPHGRSSRTAIFLTVLSINYWRRPRDALIPASPLALTDEGHQCPTDLSHARHQLQALYRAGRPAVEVVQAVLARVDCRESRSHAIVTLTRSPPQGAGRTAASRKGRALGPLQACRDHQGTDGRQGRAHDLGLKISAPRAHEDSLIVERLKTAGDRDRQDHTPEFGAPHFQRGLRPHAESRIRADLRRSTGRGVRWHGMGPIAQARTRAARWRNPAPSRRVAQEDPDWCRTIRRCSAGLHRGDDPMAADGRDTSPLICSWWRGRRPRAFSYDVEHSPSTARGSAFRSRSWRVAWTGSERLITRGRRIASVRRAASAGVRSLRRQDRIGLAATSRGQRPSCWARRGLSWSPNYRDKLPSGRSSAGKAGVPDRRGHGSRHPMESHRAASDSTHHPASS